MTGGTREKSKTAGIKLMRDCISCEILIFQWFSMVFNDFSGVLRIKMICRSGPYDKRGRFKPLEIDAGNY